MLKQVNDLISNEIEMLEDQLIKAFADPEIRSHFHFDTVPQSLLHDYGNEIVSPEFFTLTFCSLDHNNIPIGIFQAYFHINQFNERQCVDILMIHFGNKKVVFGRDQRFFYEFLTDYCHRIELSALVPHNSENEGNTANRHLARYNVRYIGRKSFASKNLNGVWMDQLLWEIITPKGLDLINKSL